MIWKYPFVRDQKQRLPLDINIYNTIDEPIIQVQYFNRSMYNSSYYRCFLHLSMFLPHSHAFANNQCFYPASIFPSICIQFQIYISLDQCVTIELTLSYASINLLLSMFLTSTMFLIYRCFLHISMFPPSVDLSMIY